RRAALRRDARGAARGSRRLDARRDRRGRARLGSVGRRVRSAALRSARGAEVAGTRFADGLVAGAPGDHALAVRTSNWIAAALALVGCAPAPSGPAARGGLVIAVDA